MYPVGTYFLPVEALDEMQYMYVKIEVGVEMSGVSKLPIFVIQQCSVTTN